MRYYTSGDTEAWENPQRPTEQGRWGQLSSERIVAIQFKPMANDLILTFVKTERKFSEDLKDLLGV